MIARALRLSTLLLALALTACGASEPSVSGSPPAGPTATRAAAAYVEPTPAVDPVRFPEDEAPHDMLTEWWYYTGHLFTDSGVRYGFELVFFQGNRGAFPPFFAAHFAVTDSANGRFEYAERFGPDAAQPTAAGFDLRLGDWRVAGALGTDHLAASMESFAIDLNASDSRPPTLHGGDGYVDFGPSGGSYYYSRTRMDVIGTLIVDDEPLAVSGHVWFDHQWGNFISVGAGGWDWFSAHLDDGSDLTISLIHDETREVVMAYGTLIEPGGDVVHLNMDDFTVTPTGSWTSSSTGATYPARWTIEMHERGIILDVVPVLPDQELDTTASTGVIYWEGEVEITGTAEGMDVSGLGYVELTGYATNGSNQE